MDSEKQNGAERPAAFDPLPLIDQKKDLEVRVLAAIHGGARRNIVITMKAATGSDRVTDNTLKRLKKQGKVYFESKTGWHLMLDGKTMKAPAAAKKAKKPRKRVKLKAHVPKTRSKIPKGQKRHHVHCVLPLSLFQRVTTKAKDKTFTQALIEALTKVYGRP